MNSLERKKQRYLRRKMKREQKNNERNDKYASIEDAFCFHKVMYYADKCCNGVRYKKSTQNFQLHMFTNIANTCRNIKNGTYKVGNTYKFKINERGKIRDIDAPHISDRLVHKVIANEILVPLYTPHMIYDNGASTKGKGFGFVISRVKTKLQKWNRKYGLNGYVVLIDFSKFFENCSHDVIHDIHKRYIQNDKLIKIIEDYLFIGRGIALGVEIAQREACIIPNRLDRFLQDRGYMMERYMDDTFFICKNYDEVLSTLDGYYSICDKLHIKVNKRKTMIVPIDKYFKYCKWKYNINENGNVVLTPRKDTIYRQRRKLRRMIKSKVSKYEVGLSRNACIAYINQGDSFKYIEYLRKI